jgi:hypothetical protein
MVIHETQSGIKPEKAFSGNLLVRGQFWGISRFPIGSQLRDLHVSDQTKSFGIYKFLTGLGLADF